MWGLATKLAPVLLAATNNPQSTSTYAPQSINEVVRGFRAFYDTLGAESTAGVYKEASPTVKFFFVTPPPPPPQGNKEENKMGQGSMMSSSTSWSDKNVIATDAYLMEDERGAVQAVADKYGTDKPIAVYLPGMDGSGISAAGFQFDDLSRTFELWRMSMTLSDRSSFMELIRMATAFCDELATTTTTIVNNTQRPIYLIAESFSGLLAPAMALQLQSRAMKLGGKKSPLQGLVLINPGTSFDKSIWDVAGPLLVALDRATSNNGNNEIQSFRLPTPYSVVGGLTVSAMTTSNKQTQRITEMFLQMPPPISFPGTSGAAGTTNPTEQIRQTLEGYRDMLELTAERLPSDLVEHRLNKWMMVGHALINPRLNQLEVPTLIVVGKEDKLLGSGKEAKRLEQVIPTTEVLAVNDAGHFVLDEALNLTEAMIYSKIMDPLNFKTTKKPYDPILDWTLPSKEVIDKTLETVVKPLEQTFSPIFLSTNSHGKREMGIQNLPKEGLDDGPLLFVSNHQLCTLMLFCL
jgi:pimeloyl-ACP methyl ester carboxylesterase